MLVAPCFLLVLRLAETPQRPFQKIIAATLRSGNLLAGNSLYAV
jgi:hypothetical protein